MAECFALYNVFISSPKLQCPREISVFETCRKIRDLRIVDSIKRWEIKHIKSLEPLNR